MPTRDAADEAAERFARSVREGCGPLSPQEMAEVLRKAYHTEAVHLRGRGHDDGEARHLAEDLEDLGRNLRSPRELEPDRGALGRLGPGLVTGAADDDPSGIGTYSLAGAQFGYGLMWLVLFATPLMIAVQEMCGRLGRVTGRGLAAVLAQHYPRPVVWSAVGLLTVANVINIWADLNVMAASAKMLMGGRFGVWLAAIVIATVLLEVFVPYRYYVRFLKWLCLSLLAYVVAALLPWVEKDWAHVAWSLLVPQVSADPRYLMTVVGFLGTTISPYLFFWQAGETVEETIARGAAAAPSCVIADATDADLRLMRADTVAGMLVSQIVAFFIVLCTASTLRGQSLETAYDAARGLLPLGTAAYTLFTIGIIATGLLAIPTMAGSVAYAVSETLGWRYGLYRRLWRARAFYAVIAVTTAAGYVLNYVHAFSAVTGLLYAAVINGLIAPPLIVLLLVACNDSRVVGRHRNGWVSNLFGALAALVMATAAAALIYDLAQG